MKHKAKFSGVNEANKCECVRKAIDSFEKQTTSFYKFVSKNILSAQASYVVAVAVVWKDKCFAYGEYLKEIFLNCAEELFYKFANKKDIIVHIEEMPLSTRTVQK